MKLTKEDISDILKKSHEVLIDAPEFDGDTWSTVNFNTTLSGKNFNIDIECQLIINWVSHEEFDYGDITCESVKVIDDDSNQHEISDKLLDDVLNTIEFIH